MGEVQIEQRDHLLVATLANPPHALMDVGVVKGLEALVTRAESDERVGAVVLTGAHEERFIAHYDVGELLAGADAGPSLTPRAAHAALRAVGIVRKLPLGERALARSPAAGLLELERFHETLDRMNRCGAVFVAALNGSAMGVGCELALTCDVRILAAGDHRIGQPEILLGFTPGGGGIQRLVRLLGSGPALRLLLDGGPLAPEQAAALGLVDEVVPGESLMDRAVAVADRLGRRPRSAIAACKRAVYRGGSMPIDGGLRLERAEFLATLGTPEAQRSMRAYLDGLDRTGTLPGYDRATLERALASGRFTA